jgi:peptidyl-prolyl cis-trans isomerase C
MFRSTTLFVALAASMLAWQFPAVAQTSVPAPAPPPVAAQPPSDEVLAENARTRLTRADYDADIQRVPVEMRDEFASDPKRLSTYLTNLLIVKTLAADARAAGLENDPLVQRRIALEVDRVLADAQLRHLEQGAGSEFDAKADQFALKAKEIYLVEKDKHQVPEQISASQILFDTKHRTPEAALALARETRSKLLAGADFATTAKAVSDDPSAKTNGGEIGWFARERMDPAFSQAAFAMTNAGDISEPVLTRFGYHLIRFEGRRPAQVKPFEAVEPKIMSDLRKRYIEEQRDARVAGIRNDPNLKVNQPAVDSLVVHIDPSLFRRHEGRRSSDVKEAN